MKYLSLIILITMSAVVSCFPMAKTMGISSVPNIENKFSNESERILVFPIWEDFPVAYGFGSKTVLSFGKPLFLMVKNIWNLPALIPSKTSVVILSPDAAIGRMKSIYGITIISESGKIVTLRCPVAFNNPMTRCPVTGEECVDQWMQKKIVSLFKELEGESTSLEQPILAKLLPSHIDSDQHVKVTNSIKERQSIVKFLSGINNRCYSLHFAATKGENERIKVLIETGTEVDILSAIGKTPLMLAAENGQEETVRVLIAAGAEVNVMSKNGNTALMLAVENGHEGTVEVLVDEGVDINVMSENGNTALMLAARNGYVNTVRLLVEKGAEVNAQNSNGETSLHFASARNQEKIVKLLLENAADVDAKTQIGDTPLIFAVENRSKEVAETLINANADINFKNNNKQSALSIARDTGRIDIIELLEDAGAKE